MKSGLLKIEITKKEQEWLIDEIDETINNLCDNENENYKLIEFLDKLKRKIKAVK